MPKFKLDSLTCASATCPAGKRKIDLWDTHLAGFVLECRSSGGKTYYLRYFDAAGRQRQHKIGGFADISFDQARKAARRLRSEVVLGGDPSAAKDEKKGIPTYAALSAQHLAHAQTYMRSYSALETNMRLHLVPQWGRLRLDEITPQAISAWLADKMADGASPAFAEKLRVTLGAHMSWPGSGPSRAVTRTRLGACLCRCSTTSGNAS